MESYVGQFREFGVMTGSVVTQQNHTRLHFNLICLSNDISQSLKSTVVIHAFLLNLYRTKSSGLKSLPKQRGLLALPMSGQ